jgi:hypothetical protein
VLISRHLLRRCFVMELWLPSVASNNLAPVALGKALSHDSPSLLRAFASIGFGPRSVSLAPVLSWRGKRAIGRLDNGARHKTALSVSLGLD